MLKPQSACDNLFSPDQMAPSLFKNGLFALQVKIDVPRRALGRRYRNPSFLARTSGWDHRFDPNSVLVRHPELVNVE